MKQICIDMRKVCILFLLVIASIGTVSAATVRIEPHDQQVDPGETFTVDVYIDPEGATVAGAQFSLNFDPSTLRANSVTEGNFLKGGGSTYFNPGTIDNVARTITNVNGAALYAGGATQPGTFATLSFTMIGTEGTSSVLDLFDVLVSDTAGDELPCQGDGGECGNDGFVGIPLTAITVRIEPHDQQVDPGETFTVDVYIDPEGITAAGAQFSLNFDPSTLRANGVTEGNFLNRGGPTYFNPGTIDNDIGNIINVNGAVIAPNIGTIQPGTFATLSFTAIGPQGASSVLDLFDVLVSDTTGDELPCQGDDGECGNDGFVGIDVPVSNWAIVGFIAVAGLIFVAFGRRRNK